MRTLKEKAQSRAKAQELQAHWKQIMSNMNDSEITKLLLTKKEEQNKPHDIAYSMTLSQVVEIIKRELHDRGLEYLLKVS